MFGKTEKHNDINEKGEQMALTLKAARINAGYDQRKAAEYIGVTPETLGKWEAGKTFPTVPQITKIEELYKISYSDINFLPQNFG